MKRYFPLGLVLFMVVWACTNGGRPPQEAVPDKASLRSEIDALEAYFKAQDVAKPLDQPKARTLIEKSKRFAQAFPGDPLGGAYLFRSGEVARGIRDYAEAIALFEEVETKYPSHERAPQALFLRAFTYEENMRDVASAKKYYQLFLKKYPNHAIAAHVKDLLKVVETPPEELIKQFKEKEQH